MSTMHPSLSYIHEPGMSSISVQLMHSRSMVRVQVSSFHADIDTAIPPFCFHQNQKSSGLHFACAAFYNKRAFTVERLNLIQGSRTLWAFNLCVSMEIKASNLCKLFFVGVSLEKKHQFCFVDIGGEKTVNVCENGEHTIHIYLNIYIMLMFMVSFI